MRVRILVLLGLLINITAFCQQSRTVTGKVTDLKDGAPLAGVTVKAKGQTQVTSTGADGTFTITIPDATQALQFSYIGYGDLEVPVSEKMAVIMSASEKSLNEVVVVGYGTATKKNVSGSISKVSGKEIANFPTPSFESALQGKAPGVVVESGSGKVGQGIKVRIRGTSSISASSQPLYVVDGLPVTASTQSDPTNDPTDPLADINPNDIESVEILKDASASAIYGARAANGVVLITTKKGRNSQKTAIELNVSTGWSNPTKKKTFLNAKQYVDLINIAAQTDAEYDFNNDISGYPTLDDAVTDYQNFYYSNILDYFSLGTDWRNQEVDVNWQDLLYNKDAPSRQVDLSASGGSDKTRFFISGFYNDQEAIVINNQFNRYGGRFNLEHNATSKLAL